MRLENIISGIEISESKNYSGSMEIEGISSNSSKVENNYIFIAVKGIKTDGHKYINNAVKKGASVIIHDSNISHLKDNICYLKVHNTREIISRAAGNYYNNPGKYLKIIGITGTNGKTTTTYLIENILNKSGNKCSVFGTINYRIDGEIIERGTTTPDPISLQKYYNITLKKGIKYVILEISSHAIDQHRVNLKEVDYAIYTNISQDHLDYHKDMDDYAAVKSRLFENLERTSHAIINNDDHYKDLMIEKCNCNILTYGTSDSSDITAKNVVSSIEGISFTIDGNEKGIQIKSSLIGEYNTYNILSAYAVLKLLKIEDSAITEGIIGLNNIPGRCELLSIENNFEVIIDYAHTPDALKKTLQNIKKISMGKVVVVFGCGGDRDKEKRPLMGEVAVKEADYAVITSDNPRSENPTDIINDILKGIPKNQYLNYVVEEDRTRAIRKGLNLMRDRDILVIAGKGHEDYQILKDETIHFSDKEEVLKIINDMNSQ